MAKGEGAKTSPVRGGFTPSKQPTGRRLFEAQGSFALCGARLKELFEKSSLRIFKNFPAAVIFYLIENFRVREFTLILPKANLNSRLRDLISGEARS